MKSFRHRVCATAALTLFFGGLSLAVLEGPAAAEEKPTSIPRVTMTCSRLFQGFTEQTDQDQSVEGSGGVGRAHSERRGEQSSRHLISVDAGRLAPKGRIFQPVSSEVLEEQIHLRHRWSLVWLLYSLGRF